MMLKKAGEFEVRLTSENSLLLSFVVFQSSTILEHQLQL